MNLIGGLGALLLVVSIALAIAQSRGRHPIETGIERSKSMIAEIRTDADRPTGLDDVEPESRAETDGGSRTSRLGSETNEIDSDSSDRTNEIDLDRDDRDDRGRLDSGARSSSRWEPDDPAPLRPIRLDRETETIEIEVPDDVEIEIRRSG